MAICFVQIVIICVGRLTDRHTSSSLAAMSQIKWLTNFFSYCLEMEGHLAQDRTPLLQLCMLFHELLVT